METGELLAVYSGFLEVGEGRSWGFTLDQTAEAEEDCHCVRGWGGDDDGDVGGGLGGLMLYFSSLVGLRRYAFDALFCEVAQDVGVHSSTEIELSHFSSTDQSALQFLFLLQTLPLMGMNYASLEGCR